MPAKSPEPPKITLKFGGQKATASAPMSVDNESLKRQQELVRAGANGYAPGKGNFISLPPGICEFLHSRLGSMANPASNRLSHERSGSTEQAMGGMKTETAPSQSPALNAIPNGTTEVRQSPSASTSQMPPPIHLSSRVPSGSPHPQAAPNGVAPTSQASNTPFNSRLRQPGKGNILVYDDTLNLLNCNRCFRRPYCESQCRHPSRSEHQGPHEPRHLCIAHSYAAVPDHHCALYALLPAYHAHRLLESHASAEQDYCFMRKQ